MLLGIDQGTTGTRACLVSSDGRIVSQAYAAHAQHEPHAGWVEHDPDELWACTTRVIAEVLARGARPVGIALANQGETVMIWDARTRRPLHRALVWQDTRTAPLVAELASDPAIAARVRELTGLRLDPYFSAPKLRWLLDEVPEARALAAAGHLRAGTLDTWLVDRLTDGAVFATDASTAARTLLCDIASATWSAELCALFAIPPAILAEIRDTDAGFGTCAGHGLDGVPIVASVVDQPAALIGQGCVEPGEAKATFGTGCFVYVNAGQARPHSTGTLATIAWRRDGVSTYALDGGVLAVGSALSWLSELGLGDVGLPAGTRRARRDPGVTCVPALVGLGAPHWDRAARGAWLGISNATTRADLADAFIEGLACRVVEVIDAIEADAGLAISELHVDGGLTRAPGLMQLQADLLGRPVVVAEADEATVIGACTIAALRLGLTTLADVHARRTRSRRRYEPVMSADERAATLLKFRRAIALVRQWG